MSTTGRRAVRAAVLGGLLLLAVPARAVEDTHYEGTFELKANGDMAVVIKLTPPMMRYQMMRDNISNLYLMLRNLASERAATEVAEKKAEWDDANRTITFSMTVLGAGRNMGKHWEVDIVKNAVFSNLDEAKRTLYFSEQGSGMMGNVRGNTKVVLPDEATECKFDADRHVASYVLPIPEGASGGGGLWTAAIVLWVFGAVLAVASFVVKPALGTT